MPVDKKNRIFPDRGIPKKRRRNPFPSLSSQGGYTLVEVVIACGLMVGVLVPAILFFGRLSSNRTVRGRFIAMQAAREVMEQTLGNGDFRPIETVMIKDGREWRVARSVEIRDGFTVIEVTVFASGSDRPTARLKTGRMVVR